MGALMLVHGLAHGAWCWGRTKADLVGRGHDVVAVDLPLTETAVGCFKANASARITRSTC